LSAGLLPPRGALFSGVDVVSAGLLRVVADKAGQEAVRVARMTHNRYQHFTVRKALFP
jgi:hypothetical protein